eukprot:gene367-6781_t
MKKFVATVKTQSFKVENSYFTNTFKGDKFEKDKMEFPKYPTSKSKTIQTFAKDLFRHGYNTNNLGYFYYSLREIQKFMKGNYNQGLPAMRDSDFYQKFYDLGIADDVTFDLFDEIYATKNVKNVKDIIECYNFLFTGYYKCLPGMVTLGDNIPQKYESHIQKMKNIVAQLSTEERRIFLDEGHDFSKFGGFTVESLGNSLGFDVLSRTQSIMEDAELEKIVSK